MLRKEPDDAFELRLHRERHLGPRLAKVLEVRRREHEHLARAVRAIEVVAVAGPRHLHPCGEVLALLRRALREQVVGDAHRQQAGPVEFVHHRVVVGVVLEPTPRVDGAGHTETVELTHEVARGHQLMLARQLRTLGERRVEDEGIRLGDQQPGWVTGPVALHVRAHRVRRLLRVSEQSKKQSTHGIRRQAAIFHERRLVGVPLLRHVHPEGGQEIDKRLAREVEGRNRLAQGHEHRMDRLPAEAVIEHPPPFVETLDPASCMRLLVCEIVRDARESVDRLDGGAETRRHEPRGHRKVLVVPARQPGAEQIRGAQVVRGGGRFLPGERLGPGRRAGHGRANDITVAGGIDAAGDRSPPLGLYSCPFPLPAAEQGS